MRDQAVNSACQRLELGMKGNVALTSCVYQLDRFGLATKVDGRGVTGINAKVHKSAYGERAERRVCDFRVDWGHQLERLPQGGCWQRRRSETLWDL
jgi:hypothetical protein